MKEHCRWCTQNSLSREGRFIICWKTIPNVVSCYGLPFPPNLCFFSFEKCFNKILSQEKFRFTFSGNLASFSFFFFFFKISTILMLTTREGACFPLILLRHVEKSVGDLTEKHRFYVTQPRIPSGGDGVVCGSPLSAELNCHGLSSR